MQKELLKKHSEKYLSQLLSPPPADTKKIKISIEYITKTDKIKQLVTIHKNGSVTIHKFS